MHAFLFIIGVFAVAILAILINPSLGEIVAILVTFPILGAKHIATMTKIHAHATDPAAQVDRVGQLLRQVAKDIQE